MRADQHFKQFFRLILPLTIFLLIPGPARNDAYADAGKSAGGGPAYERAGAGEIRAEIDEILSDPRFAPRITFWQWLAEKLSAWGPPDINFESGWRRFFFWLFISWCVLALAAILGHLIWTIFVLIRGRKPVRRTGREIPHYQSAAEKSHDALLKEMERMAESNDLRGAVSLMMLILLRRLEKKGVLEFHESKTNSDYLREYSPGAAGRDLFRKFIIAFDSVFYSGVSFSRETFNDMSLMFNQIGSDG